MRAITAQCEARGSLIPSITSVVPILGILAAPFAIVFGIAGRRPDREGARQSGLATAGLTLGAIGFVLWGVLMSAVPWWREAVGSSILRMVG